MKTNHTQGRWELQNSERVRVLCFAGHLIIHKKLRDASSDGEIQRQRWHWAIVPVSVII